jgi:hypothetical protein
MNWNELNSQETTFKRIRISERSWHFRLFIRTFTVNGKLPIWICPLDVYLLRILFFGYIVAFCWMRNLIKRQYPKIKNARWKHMPRVEFIEVEDSVSEYIDVGG